jgi:hypothetical protein
LSRAIRLSGEIFQSAIVVHQPEAGMVTPSMRRLIPATGLGSYRKMAAASDWICA